MLTANKTMTSWPLRVEPIACGSVDVWCISVKSMERRLEYLSSLLTVDEIRKAKAYRFERHRQRFCIARGMLRALLGEYLGCAAARVRFSQGAEGKPALAGRSGRPLHFNVSHSTAPTSWCTASATTPKSVPTSNIWIERWIAISS
jgi:hypothetical protein